MDLDLDEYEGEQEVGLPVESGRSLEWTESPQPWARTVIALAASNMPFAMIAELVPGVTESDVTRCVNRYGDWVGDTVAQLKVPVEQMFRALQPKAMNRLSKILDDDTVSPAIHMRAAFGVTDRIYGTPTQRKISESRVLQINWNDIPGKSGQIGSAGAGTSDGAAGIGGDGSGFAPKLLDGPLGDLGDLGDAPDPAGPADLPVDEM